VGKVAEPPCKIESTSSPDQLAQYRNDLAGGFFETVIQQCLAVVNKNDAVPPADLALYALGEVYAHHAYQGKDYELSRYYFARLIANFPESQLTSEARTFVGLYDTFAEKEKKIASLEKEQQAKVPPTREAITDRNFEAAVKENLQIIKVSGQKTPADHALYNLGLIYAHIDNPGKDFQKARKYFAEVIKEFPASSLVEESRVWLGLFEVFEKMQQIDLDIEQQKKQLNR
jgi:TolA-binding protein